jgi:hypothetical protein
MASEGSTELARKWRRIELGNTLAGFVVSTVAIVLLPGVVAALVVVLMALGVADTWYLGSRLRRTGRLFKVRRR